jgi:hypothetical protein
MVIQHVGNLAGWWINRIDHCGLRWGSVIGLDQPAAEKSLKKFLKRKRAAMGIEIHSSAFFLERAA